MAGGKIIQIAAALLLRDDGDTLLVRKQGTRAFMQPGGKIEAGESPVEALLRELAEEIGVMPRAAELVPMGQFQAVAAHEPDHIVLADVFRFDLGSRAIHRGAEIEEVLWVSPLKPGNIPLAELTAHHILPAFRRSLSART